MQRQYVKRKVGGKQIEYFERRRRDRQPRTAACSFRLCCFQREKTSSKKRSRQTKIWISSTVLWTFFRPWSLPSEPVLASGA